MDVWMLKWARFTGEVKLDSSKFLDILTPYFFKSLPRGKSTLIKSRDCSWNSVSAEKLKKCISWNKKFTLYLFTVFLLFLISLQFWDGYSIFWKRVSAEIFEKVSETLEKVNYFLRWIWNWPPTVQMCLAGPIKVCNKLGLIFLVRKIINKFSSLMIRRSDPSIFPLPPSIITEKFITSGAQLRHHSMIDFCHHKSFNPL